MIGTFGVSAFGVWMEKKSSYLRLAHDLQNCQRILAHLIQAYISCAARDTKEIHIGLRYEHHEGLCVIHPSVHVHQEFSCHDWVNWWKHE